MTARGGNPQCPCGRFLAASATHPYCDQHPDGPPALTPRLVVVLEAAADGAPLAVVARRVGVGRGAVAGCLTECYRRLGVYEVAVDRRRAAAVDAARAVGLMPGVGTEATTEGARRPAETRTDRRTALSHAGTPERRSGGRTGPRPPTARELTLAFHRCRTPNDHPDNCACPPGGRDTEPAPGIDQWNDEEQQ